MLLSITESCSMGCTHCMNNAVEREDTNMTWECFKASIDFFNRYGGLELIISGGEPTEHPEWLSMLKYALLNARGSTGTNTCHITLTTNGMNLVNDKDLQSYLLINMQKHHNFDIQITNVKEYYPIQPDFSGSFFNCGRVFVCREIEAMYPIGRAKTNNLPWKSKCSKCFNIRSSVRTYKDINLATISLALHNKFCTPRINYDGTISLGESSLCPRVGSILDDHDVLVENICGFKCSGCDIINKNLPLEYRQAIGED